MGISVKSNRVVAGVDDLDIYAATELKDRLMEMHAQGKKKVIIDLQGVERMGTPAVQVILSARKTFAEVEIVSFSEALSAELQKGGVRF